MKYEFIRNHAEEFDLNDLYEALVVHRSGYTRWRDGNVSERKLADEIIIDQTTSEALARLEQAGLVAPTTRTSRPLIPTEETPTTLKPLSADEKTALQQAQSQAQRQLKMANVLIAADFEQEARPPLEQAIRQLGHAHCIANRIPKTDQTEELLIQPIAQQWGAQLNLIAGFIQNKTSSPKETLDALLSILNGNKAED